jgi:hypothetical protein
MLPQAKAMIAIIPISVTNGGTATGEIIDTLGYDYCTVDVIAHTANVVSNTLSVLKLQEADVTNSSSFANVSGGLGGTDFTIATNAYTSTTNQNLWKFNVDTRSRKRYLKVIASPQTTMIIAGVANLHRGEQAPISASKANALNLVEI